MNAYEHLLGYTLWYLNNFECLAFDAFNTVLQDIKVLQKYCLNCV